jgi:hypothetical protein
MLKTQISAKRLTYDELTGNAGLEEQRHMLN